MIGDLHYRRHGMVRMLVIGLSTSLDDAGFYQSDNASMAEGVIRFHSMYIRLCNCVSGKFADEFRVKVGS